MSNVEYIRRIDQFAASHDKRIAVDEGIPLSELDINDLEQAASKTVCPGTYSHDIKTLSGEYTKVALEVTKGPFLKKI